MKTMRQLRIAVLMSNLLDRVKSSNETLERLKYDFFQKKKANKTIRIEAEKEITIVNNIAFRFRKLSKSGGYNDEYSLVKRFNECLEEAIKLIQFFE